MADKKITELNELTSPQPNDLIPIVDTTTGETKNVKYSNIASNVDLSDYATTAYVNSQDATKEPTIASGTTSQYWRGDKTWQTFPTISVPNLDEVTDVGATTTNTINVGEVKTPKIGANTSGGLLLESNSGTDVALFGAGGGGGATFYGGVIFDTLTINTLAFLNGSKQLVSALGTTFGTWLNGLTAKTTVVDADLITTLDSASSFEAKKTTLAQLWAYIVTKLTSAGYLSGTLTNTYVAYWNGTQLVNSYMTYNSADGGMDINNAYIYARKTTGTYAAYFDFQGNSGNALNVYSQKSKAIYAEANTNRTTSDPSAVFVNKISNVEVVWFQSFDKDATQRNSTSVQNSSIYLNHSGRNSASADIAVNGYNAGLFVNLQPNTTSNKDINGSLNFTQVDYALNKGAWVAYVAGTQVAQIGQDGIIVGASAINASAQLELQSTTKGFLPNRVTTAQKNAVTKVKGLQVYDTDLNTLCQTNGTTWTSVGSANLVLVSSKGEFPSPSGGIITLANNTTYFINGTIDLTGDRLVCGVNTTIIGGSSENCRIKSTGLVSALITSVYSLPLRNITLEASLALNLDGDGTTTALDWFGVNFTDCAVIGTVKDYTNFVMSDCAFLNSGGMTIDGTFGSIAFQTCLFNCNSANTAFILPATLTISRRFRIIYSSFVVLSGETGINVNASATIPTESYILDTVNFSGGGTYLTGVTHTSNDSLFSGCTNITNTAVNGQLYMQANATATTVSATNTFYKVAGTTTASSDNSKFSHSDNRLTCDAVISRKYLIQANLSFTSGNNNVCEFGFYDSQLVSVRTPSKTKATANGSGRAENASFFCVVTMVLNDYIEIHCSNTSATNNITVDQLNFVITEIK